MSLQIQTEMTNQKVNSSPSKMVMNICTCLDIKCSDLLGKWNGLEQVPVTLHSLPHSNSILRIYKLYLCPETQTKGIFKVSPYIATSRYNSGNV